MTYNIDSYEDFVNIIENYDNSSLTKKSSYLSKAIEKFIEDNSYIKTYEPDNFILNMNINPDDLYIISEDRVESKYRTLEDGWQKSGRYTGADDDIRKKIKNFLMNELKINSLQTNMIINSFDEIEIEEHDYYSQYVVTYTFMKVEDLYNYLNSMQLINVDSLNLKF